MLLRFRNTSLCLLFVACFAGLPLTLALGHETNRTTGGLRYIRSLIIGTLDTLLQPVSNSSLVSFPSWFASSCAQFATKEAALACARESLEGTALRVENQTQRSVRLHHTCFVCMRSSEESL